MSGSSASPMRKVDCARADDWTDRISAAAVAAKRMSFIALSPLLVSRRRWRRSDYINPGIACTFRATTKGCDQFFQHGREGAVMRQNGFGRRQFRGAVACGGMARSIGDELWRFAFAACDDMGTASMEPAAGRRIERTRHLAFQYDAATLGMR